MNFDLNSHTILRVKHGSQAYGLAVETSDLDIKGVCIPPLNHHFGFLNTFEQYIEEARKGAEADLCIYAFKKFAKLATDCNPGIIECLFVDLDDVLYQNIWGQKLRGHREMFLSTKARHTFSGYAHSQLKRIKSHRNWLLNPPSKLPRREDFGLSEGNGVNKSELGAYEAISRVGKQADLSLEAQQLFSKESAYKAKLTEWNQFQEWKKNRNPERAALEAKAGLDCKHASHLIRLMRMCKEILETGQVIVKRPDREHLLRIKTGQVSYEEIIDESTRLDEECEALYTKSPLPKEPDRNKIDAFVVDLTREFLSWKTRS